MVVSGYLPGKRLVEIVELTHHPWFVGCQFHPELKSKPDRAHPLFRGLVKAAVQYAKEGSEKKLETESPPQPVPVAAS